MQGFWNLIGKAGQGPGKDFQYDIGEKISSDFESKSVWSLHHGKKRTNGEIVSVFICDGKLSSPDQVHLAKTAHKRLKTLRHPNIIKYIDGFESESLVYVVTESVVPLSSVLDEEDGRNPNLITWGLHQVTNGLSFLINNGSLIHENVNMYSIFVGLDGEWKLSGVEYMHSANTDSVAKLPYLARYDPPEGKDSQRKELWSSDSWGLGCLIWEIYNGALQKASDLKVVQKIPKSLVIHYCDLVSANPKSRTNPKIFLERITKAGEFLNNDFINANLFLQEIQIKDPNEQKEFFTSLDKSLDTFPRQFCVHKVLPQLLNAFEYSSAGSSVLSPLFKVGLLLDDVAYQTKILPCIMKLFSSNDRATRIQLLQQMEKFVKHLQPSVVDNQIFGCVASGFGDTLPAMREQTVKAMVLLAPKLSEKTISNQLLRYFAKLQMDEQPGIRTNTTICLGKIAQHISETTRQKVLIPAFSRAIRDPFPPARSAGIMAISATKEFYNLPDVACKLLPTLCASTVDPDKNVRDCTFKVIKMFLSRLENNSIDPESPLNSREAAEKENKAQGSSWTGWAMSSLTSRFYQQQQQQQQQQNASEKLDSNISSTSSEQQKNKENVDGRNKNISEAQKNDNNVVKKEQQSDSSDYGDADYGDADYGDAWGNEGWNDQENFDSMKEDLLTARRKLSGFVNSNPAEEHDSDSDYGEWEDDGWSNVADEWQHPSDEQKEVSTKTEINQKSTTSMKKDEQSVAQLLGMGTDGVDFLTGKQIPTKQKKDVFSSNPFSGSTSEEKSNWTDDGNGWEDSGSGWNIDDTNDETNEVKKNELWDVDFGKSEEEVRKEKRKEEMQRKKEERKLQREINNRDKRNKQGGGAMKLGAVKKTCS